MIEGGIYEIEGEYWKYLGYGIYRDSRGIKLRDRGIELPRPYQKQPAIHDNSKFSVGDKVKVVFDCPGYFSNWRDNWVPTMRVGLEGEVVNLTSNGVAVKTPYAEETYNYPSFCLEKVKEEIDFEVWNNYIYEKKDGKFFCRIFFHQDRGSLGFNNLENKWNNLDCADRPPSVFSRSRITQFEKEWVREAIRDKKLYTREEFAALQRDINIPKDFVVIWENVNGVWSATIKNYKRVCDSQANHFSFNPKLISSTGTFKSVYCEGEHYTWAAFVKLYPDIMRFSV